MAKAPPIKLKVEIDASKLGRVIADAIEENMALPVCDREHIDSQLADWERELLTGPPFTPRVVMAREDFQEGQLVALTKPPAIARVTSAEGRRVEIEGVYLGGERSPRGAVVGPPLNTEIEKRLWVILTNPAEVSR